MSLSKDSNRLRVVFAACLLGLVFSLSGCSGGDGVQGPAGDTGASGPAGPGGPPGGPPPATIVDFSDPAAKTQLLADGERLVAEITGATIASPPVVTFTVATAGGMPVSGIMSEGQGLRFTLAKLSADTNAGVGGWRSYINRLRTGAVGDVLPVALQATYERATTDQLVDNGDGSYEYTFALDPAAVSTPVAIAYEPSLTHRVGMQFDFDPRELRPIAPINAVYDFVPDGTAGTGSRKIVMTETCNGCHDDLTIHGRRNNTDYCVTCHNKGTRDEVSGNLVDFAHMVHAIHMGDDRAIPFFIGETEAIPGDSHNFGEVTYPNDITDCTVCHTASAQTPDGDKWKSNISAEACGGCHVSQLVTNAPDATTGLSTYGMSHYDGIIVYTNKDCSSCHDDGIAPSPETVHGNLDTNKRRFAMGAAYTVEILGADVAASPMTVDVRVTDDAGVAMDLFADPMATAGRQYLYIGWDANEMYNGDELGNVSFPGGTTRQGYSFYTNLQDIPLANQPAQNTDGSFTVALISDYGDPLLLTDDVAVAIPAAMSGSPMISLDARLILADGGRAYPKSAVFLPDGADSARPLAVEEAKCNACHGTINNHGGRGNNNLQVCLNCHNAELSTSWTPLDGADSGHESVSLAVAVHKTHAADPFYRGGAAAGVTFPGNLAKCQTCHVEGSYSYAREDARAFTVDIGDTNTLWTDDLASSPTAGICSNCHTSLVAKGHMKNNGGMFDAPKAMFTQNGVDGIPASSQESCPVCHAPGRFADTIAKHAEHE